MAAKIGTPAFGEGRDRNSGGIRRDDRARPADLVDALEKAALGVNLLDDGLEDPVEAGESSEIGFEAARRHEPGGFGGKERIRLEAARPLQSVAGELGRQIEQQRPNACVREMCGDLGAHRAGAEDCKRSNRPGSSHRERAPLMKRSTTRSASDSSG